VPNAAVHDRQAEVPRVGERPMIGSASGRESFNGQKCPFSSTSSTPGGAGPAALASLPCVRVSSATTSSGSLTGARGAETHA
jgi:hypothetical protein